MGSLESALLAKNRHLEHKLTMARLEVAESKSLAESATTRRSVRAVAPAMGRSTGYGLVGPASGLLHHCAVLGRGSISRKNPMPARPQAS
mgnify:CR=1 FL=1